MYFNLLIYHSKRTAELEQLCANIQLQVVQQKKKTCKMMFLRSHEVVNSFVFKANKYLSQYVILLSYHRFYRPES